MRSATPTEARQTSAGEIGGDGGIRTLDRALQPYNGLANRRLQPLGHISAAAPGAVADICPTPPAIARAAGPRPFRGSASAGAPDPAIESERRESASRIAPTNNPESERRRCRNGGLWSESAATSPPRLGATAERRLRVELADQTGRKRRAPNLISRCSLERPRHGATGVSVGAAGGGVTFLRFAGALRAFFAADFLVALRAPFFTAAFRVAFLATTLRAPFLAAVFLVALRAVFFAAVFFAGFLAAFAIVLRPS